MMERPHLIKNVSTRQLGRYYEPGEVIFSCGDIADGLFIVQEGQVEVVMPGPAGEGVMEILKEGQIFGASSLLTASRRRFTTARSLHGAHVLKVEEKVLLERLHRDPSFSFRLLRQMAQRVKDLSHDAMGIPQPGSEDRGSHGRLKNVFDFSVSHHLLLVEDDPDYAALIQVCLSQATEQGTSPTQMPAGFTLDRVSSLKDAFVCLEREKYDVLLLDLNLPDSSGVETVRRMHEHAQDTPIVVLSGEDGDNAALAAIGYGAQDYLVKGKVDRGQIVRALRHAMVRERAGQMEVRPSSPWRQRLRKWLGRGKGMP